MSELVADAQAELRAVIEGLAPPALDGLVASLRRYADLAGRAHGTCVTVTERSVPALDPATEVAAYRVAQEALHNALRHSGGQHVTISVSGAAPGIVLEVTDDGAGFDPLAAQPGGLGLASMRQRATAAGGTLRVLSDPGQGTTVRLEAPVRAR